MATLKDVADNANVSMTVAHQALTGVADVDSDSRERVLAAAEAALSPIVLTVVEVTCSDCLR